MMDFGNEMENRVMYKSSNKLSLYQQLMKKVRIINGSNIVRIVFEAVVIPLICFGLLVITPGNMYTSIQSRNLGSGISFGIMKPLAVTCMGMLVFGSTASASVMVKNNDQSCLWIWETCKVCNKTVPDICYVKKSILFPGFVIVGFLLGALILPVLGFCVCGVAAGSLAACIQGPDTAAGSCFAVCQSWGATGKGLVIFGLLSSFISLITCSILYLMRCLCI